MRAKSATEAILRMGIEKAAALGRTLDFEKFLPTGKERFTSRDVVNAVGKALDELGVPNNLFQETKP